MPARETYPSLRTFETSRLYALERWCDQSTRPLSNKHVVLPDESHGDVAANRDHWDLVYADRDPAAMAAELRDPVAWLRSPSKPRRYSEILPDATLRTLEGSRVLELGAGAGHLSLVMAQHGARVTALDISSEAARLTSRAARELGVEDRVSTATGELPDLRDSLEGGYDLVVANSFWHHLTQETEQAYLATLMDLLSPSAEIRSCEPAANSRTLDRLRLYVPVKDRPSRLQRKRYAAWLASDSHPMRDNSSSHYIRMGSEHFHDVMVVPFGATERLVRIMPTSTFLRVRPSLFAIEERLPYEVRHTFARLHLIVWRRPRRPE